MYERLDSAFGLVRGNSVTLAPLRERCVCHLFIRSAILNVTEFLDFPSRCVKF
jgi:hypothetical protein